MRRTLKWIGYIVGGLLLFVVTAAAVFFFIGRSRVGRTYTTTAPLITSSPSDSTALERGRHLMLVHGCQGCHGENLDGAVAIDMPLGRVTASNLTSGKGGIAANYKSVSDWDRAIRFGIRPNGKLIISMMPFAEFNRMSDGEVGDLIAYLRTLPQRDHELPPSAIRAPGMVMAALADPALLRPTLIVPPHEAPAKGTAEYGQYLVATTCGKCHGMKLEGGTPPDPASLPAPGLAMYARKPAEFTAALRQGRSLGGRTLTEFMPWKYLSNYTDEEIASLFLYLQKTVNAN